ncbi:MAG: hypothetical protein LBD24_02340 [Spirochaetaceae bacterium]|nr:hypothetical protein [Spirochaetaceae bacterium]
MLYLEVWSTVKGSAATATLTGGTANMDIKIAAEATAGAVIDTVTLDISTNGIINIAQYGVLKLAENGAITTGTGGSNISDSPYATGTGDTNIVGGASGASISATTGAVAIDTGDTFASTGGAVTVTTN